MPTLSALPSGSCPRDGEVCRMYAVLTCVDDSSRGYLGPYACRCERGLWSCAGYIESGECVGREQFDAGH